MHCKHFSLKANLNELIEIHCYYIYFGFLGSTGSVNELTTSATGQVTVRAILRSRLPLPAITWFFYLFCFFLADGAC